MKNMGWKVFVSRSFFDNQGEFYGGTCDYDKRIVWINDRWLYMPRSCIGKVNVGGIEDFFSLSSEDRFYCILNHEMHHIVWKETTDRILLWTMLASIVSFSILSILGFIPKEFMMIEGICIVFGPVLVVSLVKKTMDEYTAYRFSDKNVGINEMIFHRTIDR